MPETPPAAGRSVFSLTGEVAIVTGGGSGIGRAIALGLAECGARVGIADASAEGAEQTAVAIRAAGGEAVAIETDVTSEDGMTDAVAAVEATLGGLSLAVNAAGIADAVPALELTTDQFERMYRINVTGLFRSCQAEARAMIRTGRGSILNLASISGLVSHREMLQAHYNSAKAAVAHLTRSLATEWAPHAIRVNSLAPGFTLTPMNAREEVASMRADISRQIPLERFAEPEEMVGPAVFLLSGAGSYCTGVDLVVDGGFTLL
ncbi:glucose 1-dehydrogenase [Microbacterium sp. SSM24]|uniref:glucose 1-dehydrogenase n=1 Tax=Microbacterium sp. SSM24 TaxID=2991714 RepID=UPI002226C579|nr:glucose 1-dehydrogenase [Microbacterium sp. SSM24]MCW3492714.1 glucose 1-dehydrogenase [Microbacterium sp. SSM24]